MDGYAIHSAATARASRQRPVLLSVAGGLDAGEVWSERVGIDQALRIGTGAAIPHECDAVVPIEDAVERAGSIEITEPVVAGKHVRLRGEDVQSGKQAIATGTVLRPQEIGLLAALGVDSVLAVPVPTISVVSIGPELLPSAKPSQVNDANGPMLAAQVTSAGGKVVRIERSDGDPERLLQLLGELAKESDLIVTSGGISNSEADTMSEMFIGRPNGELWNVRLRPGKHFGAGFFAGHSVLSLPGNPIAAFVGFELFGHLAIDLLAGRPVDQSICMARSDSPLSGTFGRTDALRGRAWSDNSGRLRVAPTEQRGSGVVSSLPEANCLILLPETVDAAATGDSVEIRWVG